jgi:inner membrane protein YidH
MEEPGTPPRQSSPADYFAAERTFLAWIRTGLALMGFGFVVARFGLFLHEFHLAESRAPMRSYGLSLWFGTALIVLGVVTNVASAIHHVRLVQELKRGGTAFQRPSRTAIVVAVALAVLGLVMAVYLLTLGTTR